MAKFTELAAMNSNPLQPLSDLGEFGLIERLSKNFPLTNKSSLIGIGDDAALLDFKNRQVLVSTDMLVEGIHFDITYTPLKYLGFKACAVNFSDVVAMGGKPTQILVSMALSNRYTVQAIDDLYEGIKRACLDYEVDLVGGDTTSSTSGLILNITVLGDVYLDHAIGRNGAKPNELLVVSGDLGSAFMGLQVLEREKMVFKSTENQPDLSHYSYIINRLLKPEARFNILETFKKIDLLPTSMIDISDGLSSEALHLSKKSNVGMVIYEEKLPIAEETFMACEEFRLNASTVALNGGEDYELLFTIPLSEKDKVKDHPFFTIIGHTQEAEKGNIFVSNVGQQLELIAQGWNSFQNK